MSLMCKCSHTATTTYCESISSFSALLPLADEPFWGAAKPASDANRYTVLNTRLLPV